MKKPAEEPPLLAFSFLKITSRSAATAKIARTDFAIRSAIQCAKTGRLLFRHRCRTEPDTRLPSYDGSNGSSQD
ncbi:hypothetical protein AtDm6_0484 [Acetobacter tropicalis]|uniref:Uncharacterized protein n=1 Tax=Acetobacter tropicalis TaxID=104102 RepID=A0A094YW35_9PROT|nr:hypothetical protein AtDm6_0484 [Acetobacter tropicalis]